MNNKLHIKRYLLVLLCIALVGSHTASAFDEQFYSNNDILFYNPDALNCSALVSSTNLVGGENTEKGFNFFVSKGLTAQQSAGIIGNLLAESSMNPNSKQGGGGPGRGIAQWSVDGRWATLLKWAGSRSPTDLATQLDFIWYELNGSEKGSLDALKKTTTIRAATDIFLTKYERAGVRALEKRVSLANGVFGKYGSSVDTSPATSGGADEPIEPAEDDAADATDATTDTSDPGCAANQSGDIVSLAQAELKKAVKEQPLGCDHANSSAVGNCGTEVNKYTDSHLEYWCADFVSWLYKQSGKPFTGGSSGGWRIPGVSSLAAWFKKNGVYTTNGSAAAPKPGDVYFIAGYEHTGIVERVDGTTLYTISGNTSTDSTGNGNGVGEGVYKNYQSSSQIIGFGSLK